MAAILKSSKKLSNPNSILQPKQQNQVAMQPFAEEQKFIKEDKKEDKKGAESEVSRNVQLKDFFWDQFLIYVASAIALLTLLDLSIQFFRSSSTLQCFLPTEAASVETTRDQAAYVNTFCLSELTRNEYYPIFIIIQGILIVAPHFIWAALFVGQFEFFVDLVKQLDRLRDSNSGEYRPKNFDIVNKLENQFPENVKIAGIFALYVIKLLIQFSILLLAIVLNATVFQQSDFKFVFDCPSSFINGSGERIPGWRLPYRVECAYPPFRILKNIQWVNYVLLILGLLGGVYGIIWCFKRHPSSLGYKAIARFAFSSGLPPSEYVNKPFFRQPHAPRIRNDLDFLVMRLFRADSGHGRVFKDIQVNKELNRLSNKYKERLLLFTQVKADNDRRKFYHDQQYKKKGESDVSASKTEEEPRRTDLQSLYFEHGKSPSGESPDVDAFKLLGEGKLGNNLITEESRIPGIKDVLHNFVYLSRDKTHVAYDLSFGTTGYAVQLTYAFRKVVSVNFHPFYRNHEEVARRLKFQSNYSVIIFQDDIYSQDADSIVKSTNEVRDEMVMSRFMPNQFDSVDLTVIGPFTDETKKNTVNLHIEMMNSHFLDDGSVLMTIRPIRIGHQDVHQHFCKYIPPTDIFQKDENAETEMQDNHRENIKTVGEGEDRCYGVVARCDKTDCVFEFAFYKYVGKHHPNPEDATPPQSVATYGRFPEGDGPPLGRGPPRPPPWAKSGHSLPPPTAERNISLGQESEGDGPPLGRGPPRPPPWAKSGHSSPPPTAENSSLIGQKSEADTGLSIENHPPKLPKLNNGSVPVGSIERKPHEVKVICEEYGSI